MTSEKRTCVRCGDRYPATFDACPECTKTSESNWTWVVGMMVIGLLALVAVTLWTVLT